jgi:chaperonin GroES
MIQPLNKNVLLNLAQTEETKTASGLILPASAKGKKKQAEVVAVGEIENCELAAGDTVLYKDYSGTEIEFEGTKYLLIAYDDIIAKLA